MKSEVLHTVWCYVWRGCRGNLKLITLGSERITSYLDITDQSLNLFRDHNASFCFLFSPRAEARRVPLTPNGKPARQGRQGCCSTEKASRKRGKTLSDSKVEMELNLEVFVVDVLHGYAM